MSVYPLNRYTWLECIVPLARAKQVLEIDTVNYVCVHFEYDDMTLVSGSISARPSWQWRPQGRHCSDDGDDDGDEDDDDDGNDNGNDDDDPSWQRRPQGVDWSATRTKTHSSALPVLGQTLAIAQRGLDFYSKYVVQMKVGE